MMGAGDSEGREQLAKWLEAAYPGLKPDPANPLNYDKVTFSHCRPDGKVYESVSLISATIYKLNEDGTITWKYKKVRIRPWWRVIYRWWRKWRGRPLAMLEGQRDGSQT